LAILWRNENLAVEIKYYLDHLEPEKNKPEIIWDLDDIEMDEQEILQDLD
jgi:hypothetical protein